MFGREHCLVSALSGFSLFVEHLFLKRTQRPGDLQKCHFLYGPKPCVPLVRFELLFFCVCLKGESEPNRARHQPCSNRGGWVRGGVVTGAQGRTVDSHTTDRFGSGSTRREEKRAIVRSRLAVLNVEEEFRCFSSDSSEGASYLNFACGRGETLE